MPRYTDRRVHDAISSQLKHVPSTAAHWLGSKRPSAETGQSLNALYTLAQTRKRGGKPFFGHGTWASYLENVHGVSSLHPSNMPDARVHSMIAMQLRMGAPLQARRWKDSKDPVTQTGQSLRNLYDLANRRKRDGKPFFGHGTWRDYLQSVHGFGSPKYVVKKRQPKYTNDEIHSRIAAQVSTGVPLEARSWLSSKKPVNEDGQTLGALYYLAQRRKRGGKSFFGYGSWSAYLEKVHGISSSHPSNMPNARIHSLIALQLRRGAPRNAQGWIGSTEPAVATGQSLNAIYEIAQKRRRNGKPFFGYGSWKAYLTAVHDVS